MSDAHTTPSPTQNCSNCPKPPFIDSIKENLKHALPQAFYAGLGALSTIYLKDICAKNIPIGQFIGPAVLTANIFARLSEINSHIEEKSERIEAMEDTLAQGILNAGVYASTVFLVGTNPVVAGPVVTTYVASQILLNGENSIIDYGRDAIARGLHVLHTGELIDWVI